MPSLDLENLDVGEIDIGTMLIIEDGKARPFLEGVDSLEDVIGVAYTPINSSGRSFSLGDGPVYYEKDYSVWHDSLTLDITEEGNSADNPDFTGYVNPRGDSIHYTIMMTHGMGAVLNTYADVPSRWKLLETKTTHNWYLIR